MNHRQKLLTLFEQFCRARGVSEARISTMVLNGGHRVARIRAGGSFTVATYESAVGWFASQWPDDTPWPEGIERPAAPAVPGEAA